MSDAGELTQTEILSLPVGSVILDGGDDRLVRIPTGWIYEEIKDLRDAATWAVNLPQAHPPYTLGTSQ